jgi:Protein of unknown function (DUF1329)
MPVDEQEGDTMRHPGYLGVLAATGMYVLLAAAPTAARLAPGQKLDQSSWSEAQGLFPPEILDHYKNGKFASPIGEMKAPYSLDESVLEAGEKSAGRFKIDERGALVEAATGEIPDYYFGLPFGRIDPKDPQAAEKIIWNYEYAYWSNGSNRLAALLTWVSGDSNSPDRQVTLDTMAKVIEGNRHREPNPQQLSRLDRNFLMSPADIQGSASLGWRFKDPAKRDNVWAYVPALRRVRAVSPANRSDGAFGSEMTQDDGFNGFDGKPEDFTYELVGETDQYMSFIEPALDGTIRFLPGKEGGWHFDTPESLYGWRDPTWKGLAWAPLDSKLVVRPTWVVAATPKDRYYLYGKILLWIDRETYKVSNVVKYDWKGQPAAVFNRAIAYGQAPDGYRYVQITGGGRGGSYAENIRMNRATTGEPVSAKGTSNEVDTTIAMDEFQPERLVQMGR